MPLVQLQGVTRVFTSPGGAETPVLRGIDLAIEPGESVAVTGPSGCGKSTLLNLLGALDRPTSGKVLLEGTDLASMDEAGLAALRATSIGFVFQMHHLLPQCSVLENVLVPAIVAGGAAAAEARARQLLGRVGLGERLDHRPAQLSGGEAQRAAVVRALINRPKLLLADEPTGSLDRANAEGLSKLLVELNREEKVALVVVTHAADVAAQAGRVLRMKDGLLE
jgi:lipoprotein-releasing system ATP-binding protein